MSAQLTRRGLLAGATAAAAGAAVATAVGPLETVAKAAGATPSSSWST